MSKKKIIFLYIIYFNLFAYRSRGGGGGYSAGGGSHYGTLRNEGMRGHHGILNGAPVSDGSTLLGIIIGIILILTMFLTWYFIHKNIKKSKKSLEEVLGKSTDPIWSLDFIKSRVEKIFFIFIDSINEFDIDKLKEYVTNDYYNILILYKNSQLNKKEREVFERVELIDIEIVEINDFKDDTKDTFRVLIKFKAINYQESSTGKIYGSKKKVLKLKQLWSFSRKDDNWFLNELLDNPEDYSDLFRSTFEE